MLKRTSVVFVAILTFCIYAFAEKTQEQYWTDTKIDFTFVGSYLDENCTLNSSNFVACVQTLNVAASYMTPGAIFATPIETTVAENHIGPLIKSYGGLNLYQYKKANDPKLPLSALWKKIQRIKKAQIQAATVFFNTNKDSLMKFSSVLADLKPQILVGKNSGSEGFISGAMVNTYLASAVDPHTHIDPIQRIRDEGAGTDKNFAGIGATFIEVAGTISVQNPMENSPALRAGLRAKDILESVDNVPVGTQSLSEIVNQIRGPAGTKVTLGVLRNGTKQVISIVRGAIQVNNVETKIVTDAGLSVGYIKLLSFMESSACDKISAALIGFQTKGVSGIVLDLRGNGGGLLDQAICIGSLFVGKKVIVKVKNLTGQGPDKDYFGSRDQVTNLPMVTLINANSASASEILSGALQDYQRSWIAGSRSFGKATVQAPVQIWFKTIYYYSTIQRFYEPSGRTNQIVGITPDFVLDPKPNATVDEKFALHEGDYYTNALPSLGPAWSQPRPQEVARIQSCVAQASLAEGVFAQRQQEAIAPDYQLISAESILNCSR